MARIPQTCLMLDAELTIAAATDAYLQTTYRTHAWRIVEAGLWDRSYLDLVAPAAFVIGSDNHCEIAFGAMQVSLDFGYSRSTVSAHGRGQTKSTRSAATTPPNCSGTAPSKSLSHTIMATKPSSEPNETLLQNPAEGRGRPRLWPAGKDWEGAMVEFRDGVGRKY